MTVDQLIEELERVRLAGHGDKLVQMEVGGAATTPYIYRQLVARLDDCDNVTTLIMSAFAEPTS